MTLKTGSIEKRRHERKAVAWEVIYQVIDSQEAEALCRKFDPSSDSLLKREAEAEARAVTHDLSLEGLAIVGSEIQKAGAKLLLYVHPPSEQSSLVVVAEVVHCEPIPQPGGTLYRSGMKILGGAAESIRRIVNSL